MRDFLTCIAVLLVLFVSVPTAWSQSPYTRYGPTDNIDFVLRGKRLRMSNDQRDTVRGIIDNARETCGSVGGEAARRDCYRESAVGTQVAASLSREQRETLAAADEANRTEIRRGVDD